jgi:hemerythrin-like domain-containing protein
MINQTPQTDLQGGGTPLTDFSASHQEIASSLKTLGGLSALLASVVQAGKIAEETLRHFPELVLDHHAEEEKDLFPVVLANATAGDEHDRVQATITRLKTEHRVIEALWRRLAPQLTKLTKGQPAEVDSSAIDELVHKYACHARYEEQEFLPLSEEILGRSRAQMASLGLSLHLRRRIKDWRRHDLTGS